MGQYVTFKIQKGLSLLNIHRSHRSTQFHAPPQSETATIPASSHPTARLFSSLRFSLLLPLSGELQEEREGNFTFQRTRLHHSPEPNLHQSSFVFRMSRSMNASSLKRKRPESSSANGSLVDADRAVFNVIKSKEDMGIWTRDIKFETKLADTVVNKSLKSLLSKKLIKEIVNIKNKGRKHYMAAEFEPSKEVTGGAWYVDGNLDKELIGVLKGLCLKIINSKKVATVEGVYDFLTKSKVTTFDCTNQQIAEVLNSMVLDNEVIEVKSTGLGEYHSIPIGTVCYRIAKGAGLGESLKIGAMASIPCGMCPRISQCTPDGVISPSTCVYYQKWMNF
ncbi:unnamed protein product [Coffea canephora]|uniref:DNA-directed RNA polymerase III subunit RPC6 n=2 Tax=Coffea TaxID=13442 RepID=A0A068UF90_COFCA|nr:unnamed protein product [Coffea canephora]